MHDQTKNNDDELNANDLDEKDQPESFDEDVAGSADLFERAACCQTQ